MGYIVGAIVIIGFIIFKYFDKKSEEKKFKKKYKKNYGKFEERISADDIESIATYYKLSDSDFKIDEITINDIEFNLMYSSVNNCMSAVGEEYLYNLLATPIDSVDKLKKRYEIINKFSKNFELSQNIALIISKLGKERNINSSEYIFGDKNKIIPSENKYMIELFLAVLSIISAFLIPQGFIFIIGVFIYNMLSYYKNKNLLSAHLLAINEILKTVERSKKILKLNIDEIEDQKEDIEKAAKRIKRKFSFLANFMFTNDFFLIEYIKIFFKLEFLMYRKMANEISNNRELFQKVYNYVGFIDSANSLGEYISGKEIFCNPCFDKKYLGIEFKGAYHPLIKKPVSNNLIFNKPVLLTGSNATGKSTFLKTVAINQLFAQTIYITFAKEYKSGMFAIYTSMALRDSIETNESYYLKEIGAIKRILEAKDKHDNVLCLVDEVLRGTNTIERIASSAQLLKYFGKGNFLCMAATHDIELTYILENVYVNYHFQERVENDELYFDYLLNPGRSNTRNAISLLKIYGFESNIVDNAYEMAMQFEKNNRWFLI